MKKINKKIINEKKLIFDQYSNKIYFVSHIFLNAITILFLILGITIFGLMIFTISGNYNTLYLSTNQNKIETNLFITFIFFISLLAINLSIFLSFYVFTNENINGQKLIIIKILQKVMDFTLAISIICLTISFIFISAILLISSLISINYNIENILMWLFVAELISFFVIYIWIFIHENFKMLGRIWKKKYFENKSNYYLNVCWNPTIYYSFLQRKVERAFNELSQMKLLNCNNDSSNLTKWGLIIPFRGKMLSTPRLRKSFNLRKRILDEINIFARNWIPILNSLLFSSNLIFVASFFSFYAHQSNNYKFIHFIWIFWFFSVMLTICMTIFVSTNNFQIIQENNEKFINSNRYDAISISIADVKMINDNNNENENKFWNYEKIKVEEKEIVKIVGILRKIWLYYVSWIDEMKDIELDIFQKINKKTNKESNISNFLRYKFILSAKNKIQYVQVVRIFEKDESIS